MAKYDVRVRYAFEGTYTVVAEDHDEARQMVSEDCGLVLGSNIHTTLDDEDVDWSFGIHPDTQILSVAQRNKRDVRHSLISVAESRNYERISLRQYGSCSMTTA